MFAGHWGCTCGKPSGPCDQETHTHARDGDKWSSRTRNAKEIYRRMIVPWGLRRSLWELPGTFCREREVGRKAEGEPVTVGV